MWHVFFNPRHAAPWRVSSAGPQRSRTSKLPIQRTTDRWAQLIGAISPLLPDWSIPGPEPWGVRLTSIGCTCVRNQRQRDAYRSTSRSFGANARKKKGATGRSPTAKQVASRDALASMGGTVRACRSGPEDSATRPKRAGRHAIEKVLLFAAREIE